MPSELNAAFLWAQIENKEEIQNRRREIWNYYYSCLKTFSNKQKISAPKNPDYTTNNGHMFYLICSSEKERTDLITFLKENNIYAVFHYLSLHKSPFFIKQYSGNKLEYSDFYSKRLLRLPLFFELQKAEIKYICDKIIEFYINYNE